MEWFKTYVIILGLIENILDILKIESGNNRDATRESLLAAIQATYTNKLLGSPETSEVFKTAIANIPDGSSLNVALESMQKSLEGKQINTDSLPALKESAREILKDFVTKTQRPELSEQVNLLLQ